MAQSRLKALDKMERIDAVVDEEAAIVINFPQPENMTVCCHYTPPPPSFLRYLFVTTRNLMPISFIAADVADITARRQLWLSRRGDAL